RKMVEVLVLDPTLGLCWLDGKVHEVRLTLDEPVAQLVRELLRARDGSVFLELALDESGKGRVVTLCQPRRHAVFRQFRGCPAFPIICIFCQGFLVNWKKL